MKLKILSSIVLLLLFINSVKSENEYGFYSGTFDTIDKENDDKAKLFGFEHNNTALYRDTIVGRFSPITGGFITDKNSVYLYTGFEIQYEIGLLNITPSFAPGYYDEGNGKYLGSALEFKSELNLSFDIFKNSTIGYSYSHISNNDWGTINPGVNNETISFTKSF